MPIIARDRRELHDQSVFVESWALVHAKAGKYASGNACKPGREFCSFADDSQPYVHTIRHDLESFDWVALRVYAIHQHALQTLHACSAHPLHAPLRREFEGLFTTTGSRGIVEGRALAFRVVDIRHPSLSTSLVDRRSGVERVPARVFRGIRALMTYAATVARSERLKAFLVGVWIELKMNFQGLPRPRNRLLRKVYRDIARRYPNSASVVHDVGMILDAKWLEEDSDSDESDAEGVDSEMDGESAAEAER